MQPQGSPRKGWQGLYSVLVGLWIGGHKPILLLQGTTLFGQCCPTAAGLPGFCPLDLLVLLFKNTWLSFSKVPKPEKDVRPRQNILSRGREVGF
jgi:hypothetical protein